MISPLTENELKSILEIMHQMVIKAENSDWSALRLLDKERRLIILGDDSGESGTDDLPARAHSHSAFRVPSRDKPEQRSGGESDTPLSQSAQAVVEKILKIDQYLNNTLTDARKELLTQSHKHNEQIKAKKSYDMAGDLS